MLVGQLADLCQRDLGPTGRQLERSGTPEGGAIEVVPEPAFARGCALVLRVQVSCIKTSEHLDDGLPQAFRVGTSPPQQTNCERRWPVIGDVGEIRDRSRRLDQAEHLVATGVVDAKSSVPSGFCRWYEQLRQVPWATLPPASRPSAPDRSTERDSPTHRSRIGWRPSRTVSPGRQTDRRTTTQ